MSVGKNASTDVETIVTGHIKRGFAAKPQKDELS